jgi:hypothetical protein
MDFELVSEYPVTARTLFDLLRSPAFQEALAFHFGAHSVSAWDEGRKGDVLYMRIEQEDPGRDLMGRLSKSKTESSVVIHEWNLATLESHWTQHLLNHGRKVHIEGHLRVEPKGEEACRLVERGIIEINVPLLGRTLEKRIQSKIFEIQPRRVDFIMRRLGLSE